MADNEDFLWERQVSARCCTDFDAFHNAPQKNQMCRPQHPRVVPGL